MSLGIQLLTRAVDVDVGSPTLNREMTSSLPKAGGPEMLEGGLWAYLGAGPSLRDLEPQWKLECQLLIRIISNRN